MSDCLALYILGMQIIRPGAYFYHSCRWIHFSSVFINYPVQVSNFFHMEIAFFFRKPGTIFSYLVEYSINRFYMLFLWFTFYRNITRSQSPSILSIICWNMEGSRLNLNKPWCILMVNKCDHSFSNWVCRYISESSNFVKNFPPFNFAKHFHGIRQQLVIWDEVITQTCLKATQTLKWIFCFT